MSFEVLTTGVHELQLALMEAKVKVDPVLGKALSAAAEPVKADVKRRANGYGGPTVAGVRIRRKGTFVRVEQGARKTTGRHAQFGAFQQRNFFDPALEDNKEEVTELATAAIDLIAEQVNAAP